MRVISGKYKGIILEGINIDGTRPTMDRVKESMFAIIQNNIKNSICLDLFAGSGSLGIEALSNGASMTYFVDKNKVAMNIIKKNINKLSNANVSLINKDYLEALKSFKINKIKFDIIFLDPPYNLNLINDCLIKIVEYELLNRNGLVICEFENEQVYNENLIIIKERKYGSKSIIIYKNNSE